MAPQSISDGGIRLALLDGMKAEEERTAARLADRLREKSIELFAIHREQKDIAKRLLVCQRQIAALTDAIAIEETRRGNDAIYRRA